LILIVEEAVKEGGGKADWGEKGWYYVDGGEYVFGEVAGAIIEEMAKKGLIEGEEVDRLSTEEGKEVHPYAELLWGVNMRISGERMWGWGLKPKMGDVFESIPELFEM